MSFALGAFFAGVILSESELSHQAGNDSLPLKDAFAVLFFVSVGMLFDPTVLVREPLAVLSVLAIIMVGKSLAAFVIVLAFRHPVRTALTVSASLAQIGEFSFILAGLGGCARAAAIRRARSDPRRRLAVDRAQSHHLRGHCAADALARGAPANYWRCSNGVAPTNIAFP